MEEESNIKSVETTEQPNQAEQSEGKEFLGKCTSEEGDEALHVISDAFTSFVDKQEDRVNMYHACNAILEDVEAKLTRDQINFAAVHLFMKMQQLLRNPLVRMMIATGKV